jgi:hypothetical protein
VGVVGGRKDGSTFCRRVVILQAQGSTNSGGSIGPDAPRQISSLAMDGDAVWAASGPHVIKYHRGKEVYCPSSMIGARD